MGFNPLATVLGPLQGGQPRCAFPGSFNFDATCRELLQKGRNFLDYSAMPTRLDFTPISKDPAKYDRDQLHGSLAPGEGQKLIEAAREKAVALQLWHKDLEDVWPYPPIPWGFHGQSRAVPGKLRVQRPVMLGDIWEGFIRDEADKGGA